MAARDRATRKGQCMEKKEGSGLTLRVYVGPTVPGLMHLAPISAKSVPERIQAMIAECPEIGRLIVPYGLMADAKRACGQPGSTYYRDWQAVSDWATRGPGDGATRRPEPK